MREGRNLGWNGYRLVLTFFSNEKKDPSLDFFFFFLASPPGGRVVEQAGRGLPYIHFIDS